MASNVPGQMASASETPGSVSGQTAHTNGLASSIPAGTPPMVSQPGQSSASSPIHHTAALPAPGLHPPPHHSAAASPVTRAAHSPSVNGAPRPAAKAHSVPPGLQHARQGNMSSTPLRDSELPGYIARSIPAQHSQPPPQNPHDQPRAAPPYIQRGPRWSDPNLSRHVGIVNPTQYAPKPVPRPAPSAPAPPPKEPRGGISIPSPGPDHGVKNPKFQDDYYRIFYSIQQSLPESARAAVRENWKKCLLGSVFQQGFILSAMICNVDPNVVRQTMKDFGSNLMSVAQEELVAHMTTADIDLVAEAILAKASDKFLDAALEKRLPTIDAKPLINALARAARLGYEPDDIEDDIAEASSEPLTAAAAVPFSGPVPSAPSTLVNQKRQCKSCNRLFNNQNSYCYHTEHHICWQRAPSPNGFKYACTDCGQGFSDFDATRYHNLSRACTIVGNPKTPTAIAPQPTTAATPAYSVTASVGQPYAPVAQSHASLPSIEYASAAAKAARKAAAKAERKALKERERSSVQEAASAVMYTPTGQHTSAQSSQSSPWQMQTQAAPSAIGHRVPIDAYAHLTQEQMNDLNEELLGVEKAFASRFQEAELIDDPKERMQKLEGLKNSFGTRQSNVRKKYGVRLRVRRTKADILAEKERMGLTTSKRGRPGSSSQTDSRDHQSDSSENEGWHARRRRLRKSSTPTSASYPNSRHLESTHIGGVSADATVTASGTYGAVSASAGQKTMATAEDTNMSDSSSDDDDDIPAQLPDEIRLSLGNR